MSDEAAFADLRTGADYQFGAGAGDALFPPDETLTLRRSSGGRPRQVIVGDVNDDPGSPEGDRLVSSYGTDGRFTLGIAGGRRIRDGFAAPCHRMVVGEESEPFVREGRNAFAKFVTAADDGSAPVTRCSSSTTRTRCSRSDGPSSPAPRPSTSRAASR